MRKNKLSGVNGNKRTKTLKSFSKKISPNTVVKKFKARDMAGPISKSDVGSMGGMLTGKIRTKTKPGTTKTKTTTKFSAPHKGDDPSGYIKTVKGPKGQKQHFHDIDKRVTRTKNKKKKKGTKVVTDTYNGNTYRSRKVKWK